MNHKYLIFVFNLLIIRQLINILRQKSIFFLFFAISLIHNSVFAQSCTGLFSKSEASIKLNFSDENLIASNYTSSESTVDFVRLLPDGSILLKKTGENWSSTYDYYKQATPQADPRFPIFLYGIELASKMGFQIGKAPDGFTYMIAPGAVKLEKWIRNTNTLLREKGYEPISYMPIKSGFVNPEQVLQLVTKSDRDIKLFFPFDENNKYLTVHEVSFHLGAILFPRKFLERGHDINIRTQQFIEYLESRKADLGAISEKIVNQIRINRGYENDAGTANITGTLSVIRSLNNFVSYSRISAQLSSLKDSPTIKTLNSAVEFYARPYVTPLAAVVAGLHIMTGVDVSGLGIFPKNSDSNFNIETHPNSIINRKVRLSKKEIDKFREIIRDFVNIYKNDEMQKNYELSSPESWLEHIVSSLDSKIDQLLGVVDQK